MSNFVSQCLTKDRGKRPTAKQLTSHVFVETEVMKGKVSGSTPSPAIRALVDMALPKIVEYKAYEASLLVASEPSTALEDANDKRDASDGSSYRNNDRDSMVVVEMTLEDKLRKENMDLLFTLAQRYSMKNIGASNLINGDGPSKAPSRNKQRPKSQKIRNLVWCHYVISSPSRKTDVSPQLAIETWESCWQSES